jgi:hypothetical protein
MINLKGLWSYMRTLMKYGLRSCLGLAFVLGIINGVHSATTSKIEKSCQADVNTFCAGDRCAEYVRVKKIEGDVKELCANKKGALCEFFTGDESSRNTTELQRLNLARYKHCISFEGNKTLSTTTQKHENRGVNITTMIQTKPWHTTQTIEWLLLTEKPGEKLKPGEMNVRQAVKACEKLLKEECIEVHAPKYCEVKQVVDCNVENLCRTQPKELKVQVEAQLMACIAAKRDPNARKTGRPEYACPTKTPIPWCSINSPTWREEILYPDPEKAVKKQRYTDALADLNNKIADAKKEKSDHRELDQQLKNLVLEKSLGQETEERIETDICSGAQPVAECRSVSSNESAAETTEHGGA